MKKWSLLLFPVLFVLSMFVLPSQVSAQCVPSPEGQSVGACGCAAGLVVGPASKCITQANFNFAIPALNKTAEGAKKQQQNQVNSFGYGNEMGINWFSTIVLGITDTNNTNSLTGDAGLTSGSKMIGLLYTPPAGTKEYVADLLHDAGIATPAYAQGLGFSSLAPVLETWKVFRTVAYFFYVVIFLVIGFMIMFRQKIGSQTVVTVQQALPKLLISLIAVTFSYAIAGLMIELMYLSMFFIVNVFAASTLKGVTLGTDGYQTTLQSFGNNSNIFSIAGIILGGGFTNTVTKSVGDIVNTALGIDPQTIGSAVGSITGLAAAVVFALALLFSLFKLFFELLKTYIIIVIMIVTAPLALMLGALPGNNAFVAWIKGLFFNLAVFPTVLIVMVMAFLLQSTIAQNHGGFLPPYIGGVGSAGNIGPLLGLGVLLVIPDIVEKVKKMAPAGPFDEFANKAGNALKKGYSGGQLIDGLGFTDTRKLAGGGLSGENVLRKSAILAGGLGGGVAGGAEGIVRNKLLGQTTSGARQTFADRFGSTTKALGTRFGDKEIKQAAAATTKTPHP